MKKTLGFIAAIVLLAVIAVACNHNVCPAYSTDTGKELYDHSKS
jgi:hypothetical protein